MFKYGLGMKCVFNYTTKRSAECEQLQIMTYLCGHRVQPDNTAHFSFKVPSQDILFLDVSIRGKLNL